MTGSIPRLVVGSAVQLTTYSQCKGLAKRTLKVEEGLLLHFCSSMLSGMVVAICMNPFAVLTTRGVGENGGAGRVEASVALASGRRV